MLPPSRRTEEGHDGMATPYARLGSARPATRMVPAIATPIVEPRLEILRDRPEISP